jgi:hypothetical protein
MKIARQTLFRGNVSPYCFDLVIRLEAEDDGVAMMTTRMKLTKIGDRRSLESSLRQAYDANSPVGVG